MAMDKECRYEEAGTYGLVVRVAQLLAHELAHPVVAGVSVLGLQTGDYERHLEYAVGGEVSE